MLTDFARQSLAGLRILLAFTVLLGVAFPVTIWVAAQAFGDRAAGQPVRVGGQVVGSRLIGQHFEGDQWFHSRPSANDYDTLASAPSNLGPLSADLQSLIDERRALVAETEDADPAEVPADALTASASGLDPHISVEYAELQAGRVARVNGVGLGAVVELIEDHTHGRDLGFLGEPGVNVLELNVAVGELGRG